MDNTTANSTSTDGPYFCLDDLDEPINKLDSEWLIESSSESRIVLVCGGEIRIFVSMIIVSPRQCDLVIKFYHGNLLIFGFETPLNTNDKDLFSYCAKENVWPFILAQGLAEIFFLVLYPDGAKRVGVIENNLHYVRNHDQLDLFNHFLADAVKSIDRFDKESVFLGLLSVITYSIAYTDVNEFIQDIYDAGVYEINGIPKRISEFVSIRDAANCLIDSSSTGYLSRDDIRHDVGISSSTASDVMLLPRYVRALGMCLGSGALDPQATDNLKLLWSQRGMGDFQQFFSCLPKGLDTEVVAAGLVDFAHVFSCFCADHPIASLYSVLGVLVRVLAEVRYESGVSRGLDSNLLNEEYEQTIKLLSSELSLNSSCRLRVSGGDLKPKEMSKYLHDALRIYNKEECSFQDALSDNEPIGGHSINIIAIARALLVMNLLGNSHLLYNLLDDIFSKKHGVSRILRIKVNSAHTFEVSLVENTFNKAFIEMCGIDSRITESDQVSAVRILLEALSGK